MPQMTTVTDWHLRVRRFVRTSAISTVRWVECAEWVAFIWCMVVSFLGQKLPMESWYLDLYLDLYRLHVLSR